MKWKTIFLVFLYGLTNSLIADMGPKLPFSNLAKNLEWKVVAVEEEDSTIWGISPIQGPYRKPFYFYASSGWNMIGVPRTGNHVLKFNIPADDSDTNAVSADCHSAIIPVSSGEKRAAAAGWTNGGSWLDQHKDINLIGQTKDVELVFLGNSITQSWGGEGRHVWEPGQKAQEKYFGKVKTANFGISGDRTQHLLWRIENGNFDHILPEVIILMIGTNNLNDNTENEIAEGIEAVVNKLRTTVPESKILLLGIFPRGEQPEDPFRQKIKNINESISHLNDDNHIFYRDIGKIFLHPDGAANKTLMSDDCLHLRPAGYEAWAKAIAPLLKQMGIDTK